MPKIFLPQINRERKNKVKAEVLKNDQTKEIFFFRNASDTKY